MIKARINAQNSDANLRFYDQVYKHFSWEEAEKEFTWYQTGRINIVHEAIDRWADHPDKQNQAAIIFEKAGNTTIYTYSHLREISCRWANLLLQYGFQTGDRLFIFLPLCPEIYFAIFACARLGVTFCPLFSSLTFDELEDRIGNASPLGILTHPDFAEYLPPDAMKSVKYVFVTQSPLPGIFEGEILTEGLIEEMPAEAETCWVRGDTPLYLLYTSGSTGPPKGVIHAHHDMVGHLVTARYVLDFQKNTVFWTDAEPSWVTGTVYGTFAPLLCGITSVVQADPFSASNWYRTLEKHRISVCYTTPWTIRRLMDAGEDLVSRYNFSYLRHVAVVGEALSPQLIFWFKKNFDICPHDTWWMTETGMICIANFQSEDVKPGSMGKPVPGVEAAVIDENGTPLPNLSMGELALRPGWRSMMTAIWQDEERYQAYFRLKNWFLTGDMVIRDEEGYYYHQGRTDDLIKAGVKFIGPYEIERAICRHPAVREAAVISRSSKPGEPFVKAFIAVNIGFTPSARLNQEIRAYIKSNLPSEAAISEIEFLEEIPKTRSGKLLRRVLRARELGLPIGDPLKIKED